MEVEKAVQRPCVEGGRSSSAARAAPHRAGAWRAGVRKQRPSRTAKHTKKRFVPWPVAQWLERCPGPWKVTWCNSQSGARTWAVDSVLAPVRECAEGNQLVGLSHIHVALSPPPSFFPFSKKIKGEDGLGEE